jgi:molecular chaperone DnaK (HSP70)
MMPSLGIDFGTSNTRVALRLPGRPSIALPIAEDGITPYMPSVVAFPRREGSARQVLVGEEAERAADAAFLVRSVKRCLGCQGQGCEADRMRGQGWCTRAGLIRTPVGDMKPETIAFLIVEEALKRALRVAESIEPGIAQMDLLHVGVRLGCGATFNHEQRRLLAQIAAQLGFRNIDLQCIVDEPIAAGISYARLAGVRQGRALIYDFGGGTFDTALIDVDENGFTVLAADGVDWLGGDDVDRIIYDHFLATIGQACGLKPDEVSGSLSPLLEQHLRRQCTEAKERLSDDLSYKDTLFSDEFGMVFLDLTRQQLESMVRAERRFGGFNLIERSLECVLSVCRVAHAFVLARNGRLLSSHDIKAIRLETVGENIDHVVLVGGLTRMPLVKNRILELFGEDKVITQDVLDPMSAVALGTGYTEERHFSLLYPPYSIELVLSHEPGGEDKVVELHHAYDKLDFFQDWPSSTRPVHRGPICCVPSRFAHSRLRFRGDGIAADEVSIRPSVRPGRHAVYVDLAGRLRLDKDITLDCELCTLPLRHRWQEEIVRTERRRQKIEIAKQEARLREMQKDIGLEN